MNELWVVDAFTNRPFAGNPAAVCLLSEWPQVERLQQVACEMNLSETAFVVKEATHYHIRWFTPTVEVALCGHATLATAQVLFGKSDAWQLEFTCQSGRLSAQRLEQGWIRLDFPATPPQAVDAPEGLLQALGCEAQFIGKSRFDYLVQVQSEEVVRNLKPQHSQLARLPVRGVMVTALGRDYDFVSRFFAPGSGVAEDPVTGSAHCCLTPHWSKILGKSKMRAYQASARGGELRVEDCGERVYLEGQAVVVSQVRLLV